MLVAVTVRSPDELAGLTYECQLIIQVNPARSRLAQDHAALARADIGKQQIQSALVAILPLNRERPAIGKPLHASKVDIRIGPQVNPRHGAGGDVNDAQRDQCIGPSRRGIALQHQRLGHAVAFQARLLVHRGFVAALESDMALIGRPPVARVAAHFFLRNELRHAIADWARAVVRQRLFGAQPQVKQVQVLVADIR